MSNDDYIRSAYGPAEAFTSLIGAARP